MVVTIAIVPQNLLPLRDVNKNAKAARIRGMTPRYSELSLSEFLPQYARLGLNFELSPANSGTTRENSSSGCKENLPAHLIPWRLSERGEYSVV